MPEEEKEIQFVANNGNDYAKNNRYKKFYNKFLKYKEGRNQTFRFFKNRTLGDYIKDSVDRMNEYSEKPAHKDDWQNNVFDPVTRNKLMTILSNIASARMKPEVIGKAKSIFDYKKIRQKTTIINDLLEAANSKNNDQRQLIIELYSAMSEGTVVGYEDWKKDLRKVKYVKDYNPDTGDIETEEMEIDAWDDVFGEIVPLKEFYPETVWVSNIDEIKRCFRKKEMTYEYFKDVYKKFNNASEVQPIQQYYDDDGQLPWGLPSDVNPENVFVLQYYDEMEDRLIIWGNAVELYNGPMPWNHKRLPFWLTQFEPIHPKFLYGKSLPDKMMSMQDINNGMLNGILDQLLIGLKSPIFVDGNIDDLDNDYLEPGKIYNIDPGSQVQRSNLGGVDPTAFQVLSLIKRSMEESSVSAQAQGIATGGRKTRYEVEVLQEGALTIASLFLQLAETSMKRKYQLRLANLLQYYTLPENIDDNGKMRFKFITLDDAKLSNGQRGKKLIQIVNDESELPSVQEMSNLASRESGEPFNALKANIEPIVITRNYLLNKEYMFEVKIVPNSSIKESEAQKKRSDVAFYQMTADNPAFDQDINNRDLAQAFGKDPKIVKDQEEARKQQQQMLGPEQQQQGQQQQIKPEEINNSLI